MNKSLSAMLTYSTLDAIKYHTYSAHADDVRMDISNEKIYSHDQLYVNLSRAGNHEDQYILTLQGKKRKL